MIRVARAVDGRAPGSGAQPDDASANCLEALHKQAALGSAVVPEPGVGRSGRRQGASRTSGEGSVRALEGAPRGKNRYPTEP